MIRKWEVFERAGVPTGILRFTLSGAKRKADRLNALAEAYGIDMRFMVGPRTAEVEWVA